MAKIKYIDSNDNSYTLKPHVWNKGDAACYGCAFKFGNSEACKSAPTCTPNNTSAIRMGKDIKPFPEWTGKHLVWIMD